MTTTFRNDLSRIRRGSSIRPAKRSRPTRRSKPQAFHSAPPISRQRLRITALFAGGGAGCYVLRDHVADTALPAIIGTCERVHTAITEHPVPFGMTYAGLLLGVLGLEWGRRHYIAAAPTPDVAARREQYWWHTGTYLMGYGVASAAAQMAQTGFDSADPAFIEAYGDGLVAAGMMALMHLTAHEHTGEGASPATTAHTWSVRLRWLLTALCLIDDAAWPMLGLLRAGAF